VQTASFGTVFNEQETQQQTTDRHTLVDAEYGRSFGGTRVTVRAAFDRFTFDGTFPFPGEPEGAPTLVGRNSGVGTRWSVGSGLTRSFGLGHTVRAGVEFIDNVHQDQAAHYVDPPLVLLDSPRSSMQHAVFAQDEIRLARWLIVNAGLRYDGYEAFHRVTPRAALIVLPSSTQSVKYLYGNAFRAPNAFELTTEFFGEGVNDLRPESIDTHELV
jgi:outer membrane receptor protein involved in Fe transport